MKALTILLSDSNGQLIKKAFWTRTGKKSAMLLQAKSAATNTPPT